MRAPSTLGSCVWGAAACRDGQQPCVCRRNSLIFPGRPRRGRFFQAEADDSQTAGACFGGDVCLMVARSSPAVHSLE